MQSLVIIEVWSLARVGGRLTPLLERQGEWQMKKNLIGKKDGRYFFVNKTLDGKLRNWLRFFDQYQQREAAKERNQYR